MQMTLRVQTGITRGFMIQMCCILADLHLSRFTCWWLLHESASLLVPLHCTCLVGDRQVCLHKGYGILYEVGQIIKGGGAHNDAQI